ncbi:MAG TPA: hypothetical protein VGV92_00985 [Gammaproteobacteria bacterium]|nr:hypothetical protein [Gammaproteobacteria bacterium]
MQQSEPAIVRDKVTCELCLALEESAIQSNEPLLKDFNEVTGILLEQTGRPLAEVCQRLYSWSKDAIEDFEASREQKMALSGFHFKMYVRFLLEAYKSNVDAGMVGQIQKVLLATKPTDEIYKAILGVFNLDPKMLTQNEKKILAAIKSYEVIGHRKQDSVQPPPRVTLEMFPPKVVPAPQKPIAVRAASPTVSVTCTLL